MSSSSSPSLPHVHLHTDVLHSIFSYLHLIELIATACTCHSYLHTAESERTYLTQAGAVKKGIIKEQHQLELLLRSLIARNQLMQMTITVGSLLPHPSASSSPASPSSPALYKFRRLRILIIHHADRSIPASLIQECFPTSIAPQPATGFTNTVVLPASLTSVECLVVARDVGRQSPNVSQRFLHYLLACISRSDLPALESLSLEVTCAVGMAVLSSVQTKIDLTALTTVRSSLRSLSLTLYGSPKFKTFPCDIKILASLSNLTELTIRRGSLSRGSLMFHSLDWGQFDKELVELLHTDTSASIASGSSASSLRHLPFHTTRLTPLLHKILSAGCLSSLVQLHLCAQNQLYPNQYEWIATMHDSLESLTLGGDTDSPSLISAIGACHKLTEFILIPDHSHLTGTDLGQMFSQAKKLRKLELKLNSGELFSCFSRTDLSHLTNSLSSLSLTAGTSASPIESACYLHLLPLSSLRHLLLDFDLVDAHNFSSRSSPAGVIFAPRREAYQLSLTNQKYLSIICQTWMMPELMQAFPRMESYMFPRG